MTVSKGRRKFGLLIAAAMLALPLLTGASAGAPELLKPCGECHMALPAKMLPQRSWKAIMAGLADHFGENAALAEKDARPILDYLTSHAADSPATSPRDRSFFDAPLQDALPLRITETGWWRAMHAEMLADDQIRAQIKSPVNCLACHADGFE
jgi:cytochrome c551/c552